MKKRVGRQISMSINMPQLIFQRAESAPLSGGQSISSLGGGGLLLGGAIPCFPPSV